MAELKDSREKIRETLEYAKSMIEGHPCCFQLDDQVEEMEEHVARIDRMLAEVGG